MLEKYSRDMKLSIQKSVQHKPTKPPYENYKEWQWKQKLNIQHTSKLKCETQINMLPGTKKLEL